MLNGMVHQVHTSVVQTKSKTGSTGYWDYTYNCNNPWKSPPEFCDIYAGQRAGSYDNTIVAANKNGRTDVEGCCWWDVVLSKQQDQVIMVI